MCSRGNAMRLKEIREARGESQTGLGDKIGVARQTIAAWENGLSDPTVLQFSKLCKVLSVSMELLLGIDNNERPSLLFRADEQGLLTETMVDICVDKANNYAAVETLVGERHTVPFTNHLYDYDPVLIEKVALETRDWLGIDDAPLGDVLQLLEEKGLKVFEIPLGDNVYGFSAYNDDTGGVIFINKNNPVERQFFTALHELGHMIFHKKDYQSKERIDKSAEKIRERIANHFAGAMLIPRETIETELRLFNKKWIPFPVLMELKGRYKISMRTVLVRAAQVGTISQGLCKKQINTINAKYGDKKEPVELKKVELRRLKRMVFTALLNGQISSSRAAEILEKALYEIKEELGKWLEEETDDCAF